MLFCGGSFFAASGREVGLGREAQPERRWFSSPERCYGQTVTLPFNAVPWICGDKALPGVFCRRE